MPRRQQLHQRKKLDPRKRVLDNGRVLTQMYDRLWPHAADRLHFFRKSLGMTQKSIADDCEVSSSVICRIECGYGLPKGTTLIKIGKGIGLSSDFLLGLSSKKEIEK